MDGEAPTSPAKGGKLAPTAATTQGIFALGQSGKCIALIFWVVVVWWPWPSLEAWKLIFKNFWSISCKLFMLIVRVLLNHKE